MASYLELVQAAMRYQMTGMSRRGQERPVSMSQGVSFDAILKKSIESSVAQRANVQPALPVMSRPEVEDELKFQECLKFVLKQEGSRHVAEDGGKESSRYGILQSTARAYGYKGNVKNISQSDVEAIYRKMWGQSGARDLPLPLSLVHFDTYVNSPAAAKKFLVKSGGDLDVYLKSREQRYTRLAEVRPETFKKYLKGWKNRIDNLKTAVAQYRGISGAASAHT